MKVYVTLTVYLLCCFLVVAQPASYRFRSWDQQKGLPANNCLSVMQDRNGYIWICTINGICRFNGINFKEIAKYDSSVAIEGKVNQIIQDEQGVFWVASYEKGLIRMDFSQPKGEQIQVFNPGTLPGQVCPPFYSVNKLLDDHTGHIWVGTETDGLYRFDKNTRAFIKWQMSNPYIKYLNHIRCLYLRENGIVWVGTINGLAYINTLSGETYYPKTSYQGISYSGMPTIRSFCHWNKDTFAVATDRGAHFYLAGAQKFVPVFPLKDRTIYRLQEYHEVFKFSDQELWFATVDRGIWHANVRAKTYWYSWQADGSSESIGHYPVNQIIRDTSNNIWVCHSKGLSCMNQKGARFKNLPFDFFVIQPLKKNCITAGHNQVATVRPDAIFVWQGAENTPRAVKVQFKQKSIVGEQIWKHDRLGYIFVNGNGIFSSDTKHEDATPVLLKQDFPAAISPATCISQIIFDTLEGKERWWITIDRGHILYRYDWKERKFESFDILKQTTSKRDFNLQFSQIRKDYAGGLWIGTRNQGLFYMPDITKDRFIHFSENAPAGKHFPGNYIEDIAIDKEGQVWTLVHGVGLVKISARNGTALDYTVYGKTNGLTYLNLNQIQVDNNNNLWISSSNGLYRFDQQRKWFTFYGSSNGIQNPVLTFTSAKDSTGRMYFASTDYLLSFHPDEFVRDQPALSLRLQAVMVNDRQVNITDERELKLDPYENNLRFEFDMLDYDRPSGHYVQCKLEGYDKDWIVLQDVFQQTYNSLPGGHYTFRLRKMEASGTGDESIALPFTIAAHFYNRWEFRAITVVMALLLVLICIRMYTNRRLQKQRLAMEKKQAIELERLRISSELHDDVGGELSAIRLLSEMVQMGVAQDSREQLSKISASSADLTQKMNEIVWALNVKNDTLQSLVLYIGRYAAGYLDDMGIRCKLTQPAEIPEQEIDGIVRRNVFLLIKEALHNIVKHAGATCVTIDIAITDRLEINIHDNGKGIDLVKRSSFGNGLSTMEKRAADVGGTLQVLYQSGTLIKFQMPLHQSHTKV